MIKSLSISEWCQMAQKDSAPPVRIQLAGTSMFPLVRYKRDYVTVVPIEGMPKIGEIVLFPDHSRDLYVMHRVWKIQSDMVMTWGDNCINPDGWLPAKEILGKVVLIERGNKKIKANPYKGIKWATFWHHAGKAYRLWEKIKGKIPAKVKKIIKRLLKR